MWDLVGGLSTPTKMPWYGYSIPAVECKVGSFLRSKKNSVCSKCYARKGRYSFRNVQNAMYSRLAATKRADWAENMILLLKQKSKGKRRYFRWHDSGDLQNRKHLADIVKIAEALPHIKFWLPTKERKLISEWRKPFPRNLTVRVSAPMIGQTAKPPSNSLSSSVGSDTGFLCEAYSRSGKCGDCRSCWDKRIKNVDYPLH